MGESISQSAERERSSQRVNPVTGEPQSLHPMGHCMSHSTKRGFKRRVEVEDFTPAGIGGARGGKRQCSTKFGSCCPRFDPVFRRS